MISRRAGAGFVVAMPALFVVLWSTGFIGARLGLPHAEPQTFLALRFALVLAIMAAVAAATRAPLPRPASFGHEAVTGILIHSAYLGGVFAAIGLGLPAALAALIAGLQPLLIAAVVGPLLGEQVTRRQWLGFVLGVVGVVLVLSERLAPEGGRLFDGFGVDAVGLAVLALVAMTAGTLYQKRFGGHTDWRMAGVAQYGAATAATGLLALSLETRVVDWTPDFVFALLWLTLVLSIGAVGLLMALIRRGAASRVSSLLYLVPPCTAVVAWPLFGERFGLVAMAGMALAAVGVWLVVGRRAPGG